MPPLITDRDEQTKKERKRERETDRELGRDKTRFKIESNQMKIAHGHEP